MTTIRSHTPVTIPLSSTDIPPVLASMALAGATTQFAVSTGDIRYVVHLPFTQGGGPLYFDFLVFGARGNAPLRFIGSVDNSLVQGVSGHTHVSSAAGRSAVIADSGKEWLPWVQAAFEGTGYASLAEPPQDYARWPLGYLVRMDASAEAPYLTATQLTDLRAFNHSVAAGDVNGDGLPDYLVSGTSKQEDPLFYARLGYLLVSQPDGNHQRILIDHPNLSAVGVAKGGLGNVVLADVNRDGRDEIILSGGSGDLSATDKAFLVMRYDNGRLLEQFSLASYGRFSQYPSYNHYAFDMDNDGDLDILAFFGVSSVGFELLRNEGDGSFVPLPDALGLNALRLPDFKMMQFADVNRDGFTDIILDNLTYDWSLASHPANLASAILLNEGGRSFKPSATAPSLAGSAPGMAVQTIVTSYAGEIAPGSHRFVTSFRTKADTEFGMFAQDLTLSGTATAPGADPVVAKLLLTTGSVSVYQSRTGALVVGEAGAQPGEGLGNPVSLSSAAGKPLKSIRDLAAVSLNEDGSLDILSGKGSRWSELSFSSSGMQQGKAVRLSLSELVRREPDFGVDINGDGRIGLVVASVLDGDGYPGTDAPLGLYRSNVGTLVLDQAGYTDGHPLSDSAISLVTTTGKAWTLRGNEQLLGIAEKNADTLELLVRAGSRITAYELDADSGVVNRRGQGVKGDEQLLAREAVYGRDFNGDGTVGLIGLGDVPDALIT